MNKNTKQALSILLFLGSAAVVVAPALAVAAANENAHANDEDTDETPEVSPTDGSKTPDKVHATTDPKDIVDQPVTE